MRIVMLLIAMLFIVVGCVSRKPARPQTIPVTEIHKDAYGNWDEEGYTLIDNAEDWHSAWDKLYAMQSPTPSLPEVNFSNDMVLVYRLGTRSSGGYDVGISSIVDQGDSLLVSVIEKQPGVGCMTTMAITSPFVAVSFPKKEKRTIHISLQTKKEPCR